MSSLGSVKKKLLGFKAQEKTSTMLAEQIMAAKNARRNATYATAIVHLTILAWLAWLTYRTLRHGA